MIPVASLHYPAQYTYAPGMVLYTDPINACYKISRQSQVVFTRLQSGFERYLYPAQYVHYGYFDVFRLRQIQKQP